MTKLEGSKTMFWIKIIVKMLNFYDSENTQIFYSIIVYCYCRLTLLKLMASLYKAFLESVFKCLLPNPNLRDKQCLRQIFVARCTYDKRTRRRKHFFTRNGVLWLPEKCMTIMKPLLSSQLPCFSSVFFLMFGSSVVELLRLLRVEILAGEVATCYHPAYN